MSQLDVLYPVLPFFLLLSGMGCAFSLSGDAVSTNFQAKDAVITMGNAHSNPARMGPPCAAD
jgi:hypothetical protein